METRRDNYGRYLVLPPTGSKPLGYTRATTITKTLDDGGGLLPWKATATMVGALRRPGLMARWQALMTQQPDPWYGSADSKNAAKKLVEECANAGGSTDRADLGTALHAIIEQQLLGVAGTPLLQPRMQADIDAFTAATDGITFHRGYIETMVVLDGHRVAGTSDMGRTTVPRVGDLIADLKTGADLRYSWQSIAMQLAIYAHGDNVYMQGELADGSRDVRLPMPKVSQDVGLVIHLPAGEARCELHLIDIAAGWEAFERAMWVRSWRSRKDLTKPYTVAVEHAPVPAPPPFDEPPAPSPDRLTAPTAVEKRSGTQSGTPTQKPSAYPEPLTPAAQKAQLRTSPAEGDIADSEAFDALERHYVELSASARSWITELAKSAQQNGVSFHAKEARTVRRFEIIRALVALALSNSHDDDTLRAVLASVVGDVANFANVDPGHVLGSMSAGEAAIFARRVDELISSDVPATVDDDGTVVLHFKDEVAA